MANETMKSISRLSAIIETLRWTRISACALFLLFLLSACVTNKASPAKHAMQIQGDIAEYERSISELFEVLVLQRKSIKTNIYISGEVPDWIPKQAARKRDLICSDEAYVEALKAFHATLKERTRAEEEVWKVYNYGLLGE